MRHIPGYAELPRQRQEDQESRLDSLHRQSEASPDTMRPSQKSPVFAEGLNRRVLRPVCSPSLLRLFVLASQLSHSFFKLDKTISNLMF